MCKIDFGLCCRVIERRQCQRGGWGCAYGWHSLSPSTWGGKMWKAERCTVRIHGAELYIYMSVFVYKKGTEREGLNFASFLVPFSSFWKKKESLLFRSVPFSSVFLNAWWVVSSFETFRGRLEYNTQWNTQVSRFSTMYVIKWWRRPCLDRNVCVWNAFHASLQCML